MKPHILLVGARDTEVAKIHRLGIDITLLQKQPLVTRLQLACTKQIIYMDYENSAEVEKIAKEIHNKQVLSAILSFTEYGLLTAAICANNLGFTSNAINPVAYTRDKLKMRSLLSNHGLGINFRECKQINDVYDFFAVNNNKPIIVKPSNLAGSMGVVKINHVSEIAQAWQWSNPSEKITILAEEFLDGQEFSVESLTFNGQHEIIAITEKVTTDDDHFIEIGHQSPARLTSLMQNEITDLIMHFLNIIGQTLGPAHTEIRYTTDGPKIIESQTRIGGGQIWEMVELVTGVDLVTETVCHILNLKYTRDKGLYNAMAVRMIALENKQISTINPLDSITQLPGIVRVECKIKAGDILGCLNSSDARQGYILASGDNVEDAITNANRGLAKFNTSLEYA